MYNEVPKLFARPGLQTSLTIPDVIFANVPEQEPVMMRVTIIVARFLAAACGMMKIIKTTCIACTTDQHTPISLPSNCLTR